MFWYINGANYLWITKHLTVHVCIVLKNTSISFFDWPFILRYWARVTGNVPFCFNCISVWLEFSVIIDANGTNSNEPLLNSIWNMKIMGEKKTQYIHWKLSSIFNSWWPWRLTYWSKFTHAAIEVDRLFTGQTICVVNHHLKFESTGLNGTRAIELQRVSMFKLRWKWPSPYWSQNKKDPLRNHPIKPEIVKFIIRKWFSH